MSSASCQTATLRHRVGVGFPEDAKLLHFYTEFLTSPNFYTFTILAHFFSPRCARDCLTILELVHMAYHTVLSLQRPESNLPPRAHRQFATLGAERRARGAQRGAVGQQGVAAPAAARHDRARVPGGRRSGRARGGRSRLRGLNFWSACGARIFTLLHFYGDSCTRYTFTLLWPIPQTFTIPPPYGAGEGAHATHAARAYGGVLHGISY